MFSIIIDSREQRPLIFPCETIRKKLHVGDYGAEFSKIAFERKSIADLFGTLTFGYDRFRREFQKSSELGITLIIVVEGTKDRVLKGYKHSKRDPETIIKQLETIEKKYAVKTMFFGNRKAMANYIHDYFYIEHEEMSNDTAEL